MTTNQSPLKSVLPWQADSRTGKLRTTLLGGLRFDIYRHDRYDFCLYRERCGDGKKHYRSFEASGWEQALDYAEYAIATGEFERECRELIRDREEEAQA